MKEVRPDVTRGTALGFTGVTNESTDSAEIKARTASLQGGTLPV